MNFFAYLRYFFVLLLFTGTINAQSQPITLSAVQNNINTLADNFPQEKIYVQFDKPSYVPGETMWFKAYIMAGLDPSAISKTAYIDIVNSNGRVLKHCIVPVLQSSASSNYDIPLDLKDEYVYVKAYTRWMLNFDSTFLFRKTLHIVQGKAVIKKQPYPQLKPAYNFYRKVATSVENLENNLAFKATYFDGKPAPVKGAVFNNKNEQVAVIKTVHDGMGSFSLTPKSGETYTAKWKDGIGLDMKQNYPLQKNRVLPLKLRLQPNARSFLVQRQ